jgi:aquaporin Z
MEPTTKTRHTFSQRLVAEVFGTFALTFSSAAAGILRVPDLAHAVAPGLVVGALIYALGNVSGAHFNPAVTLAFALRRVFPVRLVPAYVLAQIGGSLLAALALGALLGDVKAGATEPHLGRAVAAGYEVVLTTFLVTVIIGTATRHSLIGADAALPVGATIALCGIIGDSVSGASMNPARSLGPALLGGAASELWIYWTAPFVGAVVAVLLNKLLHQHKHTGEVKAAKGD